jgi:hypothetical protein
MLVAAGMLPPHLGRGMGLLVGLCFLVASGLLLTLILKLLNGSLLDRMHERRRALFREELRRRLLSPFSLEEARKLVTAEDGPDWVLLAECRHLPHGGHHRLRAKAFAPRLREPGKVFVDRLSGGSDDIEKASYVTASWDAERVERVVPLFGEVAELPELGHLPSRVKDGLPSSAMLVSQKRSGDVRWNANLAGLPPELETHAAIRLLREILRD